MEHTASYSCEDNKLRLYPGERLDSDPDWYKNVFKAAGFKWAAKQECFVCARWTPEAEDMALELCGEIGDEDYSPEERSADRAERFGGYREKRRGEATGHADTFDAGPSVFGHQNRQRAERQAARHDRHRGRALSQWSKAEYWQERTAGVIAHALHKSSASVRRGRILRLEAEQRKHEKGKAQAVSRWEGWQRVTRLDGADVRGVLATVKGYVGISLRQEQPAFILAYKLALVGFGYYKHPRRELDAELHNEGRCSLESLLTDEADPITPTEAAALFLDGYPSPASEGGGWDRWSKHYELRLSYERTMLEAEGGSAAAIDIEPGGFFGRHQVLKVNRSPATKQVVSIGVWGPHPWRTDADDEPEMGIQNINIERYGEDAYRAPTDEERAAFVEKQAERKAASKAKSKANPKPKLINPTPEDAERLQKLVFNARYSDEKKHAEPINSTQKAYSSQTGNYGKCETISIGEKMRPMSNRWNELDQRRPVFKIRIYRNGFNASRVVILTDKPQKSIPWEAIEAARAQEPTEETHREAFLDLMAKRADWGYEFNGLPKDEQAAAKQLREDCAYLGWITIECANDFKLTAKGKEIWKVGDPTVSIA